MWTDPFAAREKMFTSGPGAKPEYRFSSVMEDLRRRDFGVNAIAISLNTQSRGLLLDPMNGLADLEKQEIRSLSIHGFTNQPIRLMRILRYCARMGFKMEPRTQEWFDLAMQRDMQKNIQPEDVGHELRALAREDNPVATLKEWEKHGLLALIHPESAKAQTRLRQPEQTGESPHESLLRRVASASSVPGAVLHARTFEVAGSGIGHA